MQVFAALALMSSFTGATSLSIDDIADHMINATESVAVTFSVSGLKAGTIGAVIFSDAANHQVMVSVAANGTYSTDLSALMDGTITSSLSATDSHGTSTSVAGNDASLDTDSGLNPMLSVNAANPTDVKFTVSGLESDYSGTVTFTDSAGKSDVVPIGSNAPPGLTARCGCDCLAANCSVAAKRLMSAAGSSCAWPTGRCRRSPPATSFRSPRLGEA